MNDSMLFTFSLENYTRKIKLYDKQITYLQGLHWFFLIKQLNNLLEGISIENITFATLLYFIAGSFRVSLFIE